MEVRISDHPEPEKQGHSRGVTGAGVANGAQAEDFEGKPKLKSRMIAGVQGFHDEWDFGNKKTKACRMIRNAFPLPVAKAVDIQIRKVVENDEKINDDETVVDDSVCKMADLLEVNGGLPIFHASISVKWIMRSDRAQNN